VASAPPPPDRQRGTLAAVPYLFREALLAWWNDDVPRLGASLAYYTLFAIAPVLLVAIAIAGVVFGEEAVRGEIVGQLDELLGRDGARAVQALLEGARRDTGDVLATVLGGITFALAATGAFLELQTALNTIWRVKPKRPSMSRRSCGTACAHSRSWSRSAFCCSSLSRSVPRSPRSTPG